MKKKLTVILLGVISICTLFVLPQLFLISWSAQKTEVSLDQLEFHQSALIFGARVYRNQVMSDAVRERISAGIHLHQAQKVNQLFISGDNSNNAEATTMAEFALDREVGADAILIDPSGTNTLVSCRHFAQTAEPNQKVILVSQQFHLPRAIAMCQHQGLDVTGLATNQLEILPSRGKDRFTIVRIRFLRFLREAGLTWAYLLGFYEHFSQ